MIVRIVVGAAGFIGKVIVDKLIAQQSPIIAVDPYITTSPLVASGLHCFQTFDMQNIWEAYGSEIDRMELIYAAGSVPDLKRITDLGQKEIAGSLLDINNAYDTFRAFAQSIAPTPVQGSIVALTSVGAHRPHRYMAGYDAARAAIESLIRSLALEYPRHGITSRALAVGPIAESRTTLSDGDALPALVDLVPLGRYPHVEEIAHIAISLAAHAFDCINGHTVIADGGLTTQLRPPSIERQPE